MVDFTMGRVLAVIAAVVFALVAGGVTVGSLALLPVGLAILALAIAVG